MHTEWRNWRNKILRHASLVTTSRVRCEKFCFSFDIFVLKNGRFDQNVTFPVFFFLDFDFIQHNLSETRPRDKIKISNYFQDCISKPVQTYLYRGWEPFYYWRPIYIRQQQRRPHKLNYPKKKCHHFESISDLVIFNPKK